MFEAVFHDILLHIFLGASISLHTIETMDTTSVRFLPMYKLILVFSGIVLCGILLGKHNYEIVSGF